MKKSLLDNKYLRCLVLVFTFCFTFGIFAPLDLFVSNINDLWFDIYDIFPEILKFAGMAFAAMLLLGLLFTKFLPKFSHVLFVIFFTILVILYVQGNFMVIDVGKLDGEEIEWSNYYWMSALHLVSYALMITCVILLRVKLKYAKFSRVMCIVCICLSLVQISTLTVSMTLMHGLASQEQYVPTEENTTSYSTSKNFNIIVMDTFDIRVLDKVIEENPEFCREVFKDFTYYSDNAGQFTLTDFAIPQILTGEMYLNQCQYGDFINEAYSNSPFLNRLIDDGWNTNIYTTVTIPQNDFVKKITNWEKIDFAPKSNATITNFYRLLAFRYAPQCIRPFFVFDMDDFDDDKQMYSVNDSTTFDETTEEYNWRNYIFYKRIKNMKADTEDKMFHFFHIKGIHAVRELTPEMTITKNELSLEESGYVMVKLLGYYFDKLKAIGAYDNSVIMIMADHGCNKCEGGKIHSPILLVKGYGENHSMEISKAPTSFGDLQDAYPRLLDGAMSNQIFDVQEGDERTRYFYYTTYDGALRTYSTNSKFVEYEIDKSIYDYDSIFTTGVEYE